jgi:hypothetical protein
MMNGTRFFVKRNECNSDGFPQLCTTLESTAWSREQVDNMCINQRFRNLFRRLECQTWHLAEIHQRWWLPLRGRNSATPMFSGDYGCLSLAGQLRIALSR